MTMATATISNAQRDQDQMYRKQITLERKAQAEGNPLSNRVTFSSEPNMLCLSEGGEIVGIMTMASKAMLQERRALRRSKPVKIAIFKFWKAIHHFVIDGFWIPNELYMTYYIQLQRVWLDLTAAVS